MKPAARRHRIGSRQETSRVISPTTVTGPTAPTRTPHPRTAPASSASTESRAAREWTPEELEILDRVPGRIPRRNTLTPEQVKQIRERVDSLSVPWTLSELAREFGVSEVNIGRIARRRRWGERAYEPGNKPYWREKPS